MKVFCIRQWGLAASLLLTFSMAGVQANEEIEALTDAPPAAAQRPNIVFILADDLGYTDIAPYGSEVNAPTLSALADRGVRFSNYHTAANCAPARACCSPVWTTTWRVCRIFLKCWHPSSVLTPTTRACWVTM